jgi:hypothetical protein
MTLLLRSRIKIFKITSSKWQTGYVEISSESNLATGRKQKRNKKEQ